MLGQPRLNVEDMHTLEPAHGEEVVRSIFVDDQVIQMSCVFRSIANKTQAGVIYTAGEDGHIRAFRPMEATETSKIPKTSKSRKTTSEQRYKPY